MPWASIVLALLVVDMVPLPEQVVDGDGPGGAVWALHVRGEVIPVGVLQGHVLSAALQVGAAVEETELALVAADRLASFREGEILSILASLSQLYN